MLLLATLLLAAAPVTASAGPASEMRGLWVVRTGLVSPEAVDRVVDEAAKGGFNALFVQVRGRGDAFYASRVAPRSPLLAGQPAGFDPLARLIERARARRLQVHAWVNVLLAGGFYGPLPPDHVVVQHPDWLMLPRSAARAAAGGQALLRAVRDAGRSDPDVEGYYLSPSAPGVGERLEAVVRELLRAYPLDGIHFDFIRYPSRDYDYSRAALEGFRRSLGVKGDALALTTTYPAAWSAYRRDVLTSLAARLAHAARAERPSAWISAAVVPDDAFAREQRFQDWPAWLAKGLLEAVCPMTYTPDSRIFEAQVERALFLAGQSRPVWAGVGSYRLPVEGTIEKIRLAREAGAGGVVIFSHESLAPSDLVRLRQEVFGPLRGLARVDVSP
jgi:uncharacterized lipoprotein YddW (UPF0748 family)